MHVRLLTSMAGDSFAYAPGETVTVPDAVGEAWKRAGIAEAAPQLAAAERVAKDLAEEVAQLTGLLAEAEADRDALRDQVRALVEQRAARAPATS